MWSFFKKKNSEESLLKLQQRLSQGRSVVGIDIGSSSVNVAQVARYRGRSILVRSHVVDITLQKNEDPDVATLRALYVALEDFNRKNIKYTCVVNCPQTCVRKIITPYMPKSELQGAVCLEVKRSIPFSLDEAVLDFNIIEDVIDKGVEKLSVLVAATPQKTIDRLQSFFVIKKSKPFTGGAVKKKFEGEKKLEPLGLKVSAFLPLPLCLENVIERSKLKIQEILVTVEMGTDVTELNIYKNSRLQFSRKIPFSGRAVTKSLMGVLMTDNGKMELTMKEAEKVKREHGIPNIEDNHLIDGKITTNQVLSLIRPKVEQLVTEIERSFDFYREEMRGGKVDRIVLFGGGSQLKGLPEFLNKELGVEVSVGNPLEDVDMLFDDVVDSEVNAHKLVLAIGAALSGMGGLNLLPMEKKGVVEKKVSTVMMKVGFCFLFITLGMFFLKLFMQNKKLEKSFQVVESKYQELTPQLRTLNERMELDQILSGQFEWDEALKEIAHVMPGNMYLVKMKMKDKNLILSGVIEKGDQTSEMLLSQFMLDLEKGILKNIRLIRTKQSTQEISMLEFEIKCGVD